MDWRKTTDPMFADQMQVASDDILAGFAVGVALQGVIRFLICRVFIPYRSDASPPKCDFSNTNPYTLWHIEATMQLKTNHEFPLSLVIRIQPATRII